MQSTFKVDLVARPNAGDGQLIAKQRPFATRKAHQKSRGGCVACKKRRIKCNEFRPKCTRCLRMDISCEYAYAEGSSSSEHSPSSVGHSMAVDAAQTDLDKLLGLSKLSPSGQKNDSIRALKHFQDVTCLTFGGDTVGQVINAVVASDVWQCPYLVHMVLAVSSGHQLRLLDTHGQKNQLRSLQLAEASHWNAGLQIYQAELSRNDSLLGPGMDFDSMVTAMFLTVVFSLASQEGSSHGTANGGNGFVESIVNPMASTGGFRALQGIRASPIKGSLWAPVFYGADDSKGSFSNNDQGVEGLPPAFVRLCELDDFSSSDDNAYHRILRHLTPLLEMKSTPGTRNMNKLFAFGGRTHTTFRPLVSRNDPRALLLLSWWLALLRQVDEWWVQAWARSACSSLVTYLSTSTDHNLQALLVYPATFGEANIYWIWEETHR